MARREDDAPLWFRLGIMGIAIGIWTVSMGVEITSKGDYTTSVYVHGMAGSVVLFVTSRAVGQLVRDRITNGKT